jgi:hypothetical protein
VCTGGHLIALLTYVVPHQKLHLSLDVLSKYSRINWAKVKVISSDAVVPGSKACKQKINAYYRLCMLCKVMCDATLRGQ